MTLTIIHIHIVKKAVILVDFFRRPYIGTILQTMLSKLNNIDMKSKNRQS